MPKYKREIDILLEQLGQPISESEVKILQEWKKTKADMRIYDWANKLIELYMKKIVNEACRNKLPEIFIKRLKEVVDLGPEELSRFLDNGEDGEQARIEEEEKANLDKMAVIQEDIELLEIERNAQKKKRGNEREDANLSLTKSIRSAEKYLRFNRFSRREKVRHTFDYLVKRKMGGIIHIKERFAAFKKENIAKAREAYATVNIEDPEDGTLKDAEASFKKKRLMFFQAIVAGVPKGTGRPITVTREIVDRAYESTVEK